MATKKINFSEIAKKTSLDENLGEVFYYEKNNDEKSQTLMDVNEIKLDPKGEFQNLFPLEEENISNIAESMKKRGFKKSMALILVNIEEENECFLGDGHNRREAAIRAGISKVPVIIETYETRKEEKISMIEYQLHRRNLNDSAA